jgi:hypothetical protein
MTMAQVEYLSRGALACPEWRAHRVWMKMLRVAAHADPAGKGHGPEELDMLRGRVHEGKR